MRKRFLKIFLNFFHFFCDILSIFLLSRGDPFSLCKIFTFLVFSDKFRVKNLRKILHKKLEKTA